MEIELATPQDVPELARVLHLHAAPEEQASQDLEAFTADLAAWWTEHAGSHLAFVARPADHPARSQVVGIAWLALLPRVPRPGTVSRLSADLQSVFVLPEHRGSGVGSALVRAACDHALRLGASRVTVSSGRRAVPVYERLGFRSSPRLLQLPPG